MWNVVSMVNRYVTCVCLYVWDERGGETTSYGKQLLVFQPPRERERERGRTLSLPNLGQARV